MSHIHCKKCGKEIAVVGCNINTCFDKSYASYKNKVCINCIFRTGLDAIKKDAGSDSYGK